ncbi:MAG: DsrH/TusB family sulfur metabolism protein [Glaciecola sp.]
MLIQLLCNQADLLKQYTINETPILLLQNGVYAAKNILNEYPNAVLYALQADWLAAGLNKPDRLSLITHNEWVALCEQHQPIVSVQ